MAEAIFGLAKVKLGLNTNLFSVEAISLQISAATPNRLQLVVFPCACSLRSTQCAALIALATAAGIARIEPVRAAEPRTVPEASRTPSNASGSLTTMTAIFCLSTSQPAPWIDPVALAMWCLSSARDDAALDTETNSGLVFSVNDAGRNSGLSVPAHRSQAIAFVFGINAPSALRHQFPYAIGPPARANQTPLRADGMFVPGDSAARRTSRVAASIAVSSARAARRWVSGAEKADPIFFPLPSMALRGEPESPTTSYLGFVAPARIRARFDELFRRLS